MTQKKYIGIDLGGKNTSNTVACYVNKGQLKFYTPDPGKKVYENLIKFIFLHSFNQAFIDAPLSLPGIYSIKKNSKFKDYHKRIADISLKAMSPMYLGAFTANAIYIKDCLSSKNISCKEVYPKALIKELKIQNYHKKITQHEIKTIVNKLDIPVPLKIEDIESIHHLDSLLCWISANRFQNNLHREVGEPDEGLIIY